jgi:predicted MFS family arabinose efflux permease
MAGHSRPKGGVASARLCPAVHVFVAAKGKDVDARHKARHDGARNRERDRKLHRPGHSFVDEASVRYDGWRIVAVCFLVANFGWGLGFYGQTVYLAELHRSHGWSASLISGATTFFYLFGATLVVFVAEAVRTFGPRNCLLAGVFAMAAAAMSIGQVRTPLELYLANAVLAFGWAGTSLAIITNTLSLWFDTKRGMAISLALNGASFGGIAGVPLLVAAIGRFGFSGAMIAAALAMIFLVVPIILLFVGPPPHHASSPASRAAPDVPSPTQIRSHALRDIGFLSVSIAFAVVLFAQVGFIVHLISFLDPLIGREHAAVAVALLTAMAVVGRVLFSTVIDRLNQRLASALSFASQAVALPVVINFRNEIVMIAACALFGFSVGNLITLPSLIVQREFDPRAFGVLVSLITAINQVTYAFGPGVVGVLRDLSGSYTLPFYGCMALELTAAVLIMVRGGSRRCEERSDRAIR